METRVCGPYEGPLRRAILSFKKSMRTRWAEPLAAQLAEVCEGRFDALVPVPTSARRRRERGYNPVELIAAQLAPRLGLPQQAALRCVGNPAPQKDRTAAERALRLPRFAAVGPVRGHLLLLDDVITTGETVLECRARLLEAGAREVTVAALAYTPLRSSRKKADSSAR